MLFLYKRTFIFKDFIGVFVVRSLGNLIKLIKMHEWYTTKEYNIKGQTGTL